jgi:hypothetical protein
MRIPSDTCVVAERVLASGLEANEKGGLGVTERPQLLWLPKRRFAQRDPLGNPH